MSAITKVFGILETIIAHHGYGLGCSQVVAKTRAPKATAHGLLKSLLRLGHLRYDGETRKNFGGLKLAPLGSAVISPFAPINYLQPDLMKLQAPTPCPRHAFPSRGVQLRMRLRNREDRACSGDCLTHLWKGGVTEAVLK
jgi:IclR helix-turn-helix domain